MEVGPVWNEATREHEIGGGPISFEVEASQEGLAASMAGRQIVGVRVERWTAYVLLDDGTHIGFQAISAQGEGELICYIWPRLEAHDPAN